MTLKETKDKMIEYRDFYGGDLSGDIQRARSKKELSKIIDDHESLMEEMLADAKSDLNTFKESLDLPYYSKY